MKFAWIENLRYPILIRGFLSIYIYFRSIPGKIISSSSKRGLAKYLYDKVNSRCCPVNQSIPFDIVIARQSLKDLRNSSIHFMV